MLKEVVTTRIGGNACKRLVTARAINRTLNCLDSFIDIMRRCQVTERVFVATSAVRDAINRDDFIVLPKKGLVCPSRCLTVSRKEN